MELSVKIAPFFCRVADYFTDYFVSASGSVYQREYIR